MRLSLIASVLLLFQLDASAYSGSKALIYRGPGACKGCPETVARLLEKMGIATRFIGPGHLTVQKLNQADLYIQPGGTDRVDETLQALSKAEVNAIRTYVSNGGRYLGICAGGFLAGEWAEDPDQIVRGFGLIPGVVREESKDRRPQAAPVHWSNNVYWLYFQDGPKFDVSRIPGAEIWAIYARTGHVAAFTSTFGKGRVGLIGPHPEAELDWFVDDHITPPDGLHQELAVDFIKSLLK